MNSQRDRFYGTLLVYWKGVVKATRAKLEEAISNEARDREACERGELLERSDVLTTQDMIPDILSEFRELTFPVVRVFVDLLPAQNLVGQKADRKLAGMKAALLERFSASGNRLLEPESSIELPE